VGGAFPLRAKGLTAKQTLFARSYVDPHSKTFLNATQSYLKAHPHAKYITAENEGSKDLVKPLVMGEIQRLARLGGLTKERITEELGWNLDQAASSGNLPQHLAATLGLAKVSGYLDPQSGGAGLPAQDLNAIRQVVMEEHRAQQAAGGATPPQDPTPQGVTDSRDMAQGAEPAQDGTLSQAGGA